MLNRAGILNVYQYDDEVLHFGGGRLLLRGVNGSGKSTAMNMLLPFLLDADTRRIDAAGVQSGVLRTWMLTGRDEPQPVGYLWLELARGDEHLVFGCGIRANRSTDNVSTWWFITDRRPHVDLNLVEGRTPRSIDSLRDALGPHSLVFTKEQRNAYRDELRHRLFGGADLDQHIRLLHVLRNPTVGDKIDTELERYLDEALPQLSEQAVDDAAQPLEDLEEHRRNVAQLTATDEAIRSLATTYATYARGELRSVAGRATGAVDDVASLRREDERRRKRADSAARALDAARAGVAAIEADIARLTSEISALKEQPLYREGKDLEDLRGRVHDLAGRVEHEERNVEEAATRRDRAKADDDRAALQARDDHAEARRSLSELRAAIDVHRVAAPAVDLGAIERDAQGLPSLGLGEETSAGLGEVSMAISQRAADVDEVRGHLSALDGAERAVEQADAIARRAGDELENASSAHARAERGAAEAVSDLRTAIDRWEREAASIVDELGGDVDPLPVLTADADLRGDRIELRRRAATWVQGVQHVVSRHVAQAEAMALTATDEADTARAQLRELLEQTEPDPPVLGWQVPSDEVRLGALIDFRDDVPADDRLGIEAALEASGLLAATVRSDGLALATGDLVAVGGPAVSRPLSDLLVVTAPDDPTGAFDPGPVHAVLAAISTDVDGDDHTATATDGRFRVGTLTGRHRRDRLELIGVTARRAALERSRDQARVALAAAEAAQVEALAALQRWSDRRDAVHDVADRLPSTDALDRALLAAGAARDLVDQRTDAFEQRRDELTDAEGNRDERNDVLRRTAASHELPRDEQGLLAVTEALAHGHAQVEHARSALRTLDRTLDGWRAAHLRAVDAEAAVVAARRVHEETTAAHQPLAARLATLEDALGVDYQRLLDALGRSEDDLVRAADALPAAQSAAENHVGADAEARARAALAHEAVEIAELAIVEHLDRMRATLDVPGLVPAARYAVPDDGGAEGSTAPVVERSSAGVKQLADWIIDVTPPPQGDSNAEGVRMALRRRRDTLGNGWDAEDHQPDLSLPLSVEVNGPEGRFTLAAAAQVVSDRLHQQRSLLDAKQTQALRNLLQGLIAREIATKLGAARDLISLMNARLGPVETAHGIGVSLHWRRQDDLSAELGSMIDLLSRPPDLRTAEDDEKLIEQISEQIDDARAENPEAPYRDLIGDVLDYRRWHQMRIMLHRPNQPPQRLGRRTGLSEGEKKVVSYLPLFAAVAASYDALAEIEPTAPRFILLDDAFAKVSVDNHEKLFGLLVEMELDFIATSERLWGTHASVPDLAITEVIRDAEAGVILLEHSRWNGTAIEDGHGG